MVRQKKFLILPYQQEVLDQMKNEGECRNDQSGIDKLFADKQNEQKNRKALEAFHQTNY